MIEDNEDDVNTAIIEEPGFDLCARCFRAYLLNNKYPHARWYELHLANNCIEKRGKRGCKPS